MDKHLFSFMQFLLIVRMRMEARMTMLH